MKKQTLLKFLFTALILTFSLAVRAQDEPPPNDFQPPQNRPSVIRELGLSREQIREIRRLNADRKAEREQLQFRLKEARRNLDAAIYADNVNDAEVQTRLKEFQTAQTEITAFRLTTEYEIRKILTPEQVARFRELRQNFSREARENLPRRMKNRQLNLRRNRQNQQLLKN